LWFLLPQSHSPRDWKVGATHSASEGSDPLACARNVAQESSTARRAGDFDGELQAVVASNIDGARGCRTERTEGKQVGGADPDRICAYVGGDADDHPGKQRVYRGELEVRPPSAPTNKIKGVLDPLTALVGTTREGTSRTGSRNGSEAQESVCGISVRG